MKISTLLLLFCLSTATVAVFTVIHGSSSAPSLVEAKQKRERMLAAKDSKAPGTGKTSKAPGESKTSKAPGESKTSKEPKRERMLRS